VTLLERPDVDREDDRPVALPRPRGPLSEWLLDRLCRPVHALGRPPAAEGDPLVGEDRALSLYLCYELHYLGLPDVEEAWEWEPSLLSLRRDLEVAVEAALIDRVGHPPLGLSSQEVVEELQRLASADGPSLSQRVERDADLAQLRELAVHRSAYQLKEADPHTWGIPRIAGPAKAALVHLQHDEYGGGDPDAVHARLFEDVLAALDLDPRYGALLDQIPALSLSACNLISLFGLHRRWRGALAGHLALFEMTSVVPMGRYQRTLERLGFGPEACRFYAAHVEADEHHQVTALDDLIRPLLDAEPILGGEVVFGARCLQHLEGQLTDQVLAAWDEGRSSLRAQVVSLSPPSSD
jgi:hypothetical protein